MQQIRRVRIIESRPDKVARPGSIVFSTDPTFATADDGHTYILKGPSWRVSFPELVAYRLADLVHLRVPAYAVGLGAEGQTYFASRELPGRTGVLDLIRAERTDFPSFMPECIAFDVWIANVDRNSGGVLLDAAAGLDRVRLPLFAIDFEKSAGLNGMSSLQVPMLKAREFWPRGELGELCLNLAPSPEANRRIQRVEKGQIGAVVEEVLDALDHPADIDWAETTVGVLTNRAERIGDLVEEVWRARG